MSDRLNETETENEPIAELLDEPRLVVEPGVAARVAAVAAPVPQAPAPAPVAAQPAPQRGEISSSAAAVLPSRRR